MSKVDQARVELQALMEKQQSIVDDAAIGLGRRQMYERLKEVRNEITRLVQSLSGY